MRLGSFVGVVDARRLMGALLAWSAMLFASTVVAADAPTATFPSRVVRIVSPYPTGISPDVAARVVADRLSRTLGQQVIVEARPGANGFIALNAGKAAAADGHELVLAGDAHLAINPNLFPKLPYEPEQDFTPVSLIYRTPFFFTVSASGPYRTLADFVAAARAQPGKLIYGTPYIGSPPHMGAAMLETLAGISMTHVPFKDGQQLYASVANNDVAWSFATIGSTQGLAKAGRVRLIAVSTAARHPAYPEIPTIDEAAGTKGFNLLAWVAILAPRGVPAEVTARLSAEIARAMADPEVQSRFRTLGLDPTASTPAELRELIRQDRSRFAEVVKTSGIRAE